MYMVNKIGPRTEPCGTPKGSGTLSQKTSSTNTIKGFVFQLFKASCLNPDLWFRIKVEAM